MGKGLNAARRDGERFPAASGTIIQNTLTGDQWQCRDDGLGIGVLQFDQPVEIGAARLDFAGIFKHLQRRNSDGAWGCNDAVVLQCRLRRRHIRPQRVHPQEHRRALAQGLHHRRKVVAKTFHQARSKPVGTIQRLQ